MASTAPPEFPNALAGVALISNPAEEQRLLNPALQRVLARRLAQGVRDFMRGSRARQPGTGAAGLATGPGGRAVRAAKAVGDSCVKGWL